MPEFGSGPAVGRASKEKQTPGGNDRKKGYGTTTAGVYPLRRAKGATPVEMTGCRIGPGSLRRKRPRWAVAELLEVEGVEVSGEDAGSDEGAVVLVEAAEDVVDCVVLARVGQANDFVDVAIGDGDAIDGLGGVEGGVEEEVSAVGRPDGVGS